MTTDAAAAAHGASEGFLVSGQNSLMERTLELVLACPPVREEAVCRGRTLLASSQWCRADEVAAELIRCYAGRLVP